VKPIQSGPIDRATPYLRTPAPTYNRVYKPNTAQTIYRWAQLSRFYRIKSPQRCVLNKNMTMDNVQRHNIYINVLSSQTLRSISFLQYKNYNSLSKWVPWALPRIEMCRTESNYKITNADYLYLIICDLFNDSASIFSRMVG
jgi:hypothetical protein